MARKLKFWGERSSVGSKSREMTWRPRFALFSAPLLLHGILLLFSWPREREAKCRRDVRNRRESFDRRSSRELSGHYISKPQQKLQTTTRTTVTLWYLGKLGLILNTYYDLLDTYKSTVYVGMIFTPEVSFYNIRAKWDTITDCIGQVTISNWIFTQRPKVTGTYLQFGSMVLAIWIKFCSAALYFF